MKVIEYLEEFRKHECHTDGCMGEEFSGEPYCDECVLIEKLKKYLSEKLK